MLNVSADDTIVALASAPGRGAIAIVRLSGRDAFPIARRHIDPWPQESRKATLCTLHDGDSVLDQVIATRFDHPASFTGEDIVEISSHGGQLVSASIIAALISSGARQATPGEFTQRALLNGKIDILQAEAIADLIDARSTGMQRIALDQLDGGLSRRLAELRNDLLQLEALIAYDVDFPEEDDGPVPAVRVEAAANTIIRSLQSLLATAGMGELVRDGAVVVIAGPPNVGKSSLFNAILGKSRAIVTDIPGTTRDALEAVVETDSWPIRLVDTAGLRATDDQLERLGIEVSERYLAQAEIILACGETRAELEETMGTIAGKSRAIIIPVRTKSDLVSFGDQNGTTPAIAVSATTGQGLVELLAAVARVLSEQHGRLFTEEPVLTRARHREALAAACREAEAFIEAWRQNDLPATIAAVHVRTAVTYLEELVGNIQIEDVLDRVFSSFCVGK